MTTPQEDLINFVTSDDTLKAAAKGSMEKRAALMYPQEDAELQAEVKGTILRPLADKFQEITRQIDSGKYKLPKTLEEAELITENYIEQAWQRLEPLIKARDEQRDREWYITDVLPGGDHVTVLGPFTTDKDAGVAREYMERSRKNYNKTFWIERITNPQEQDKEGADEI